MLLKLITVISIFWIVIIPALQIFLNKTEILILKLIPTFFIVAAYISVPVLLYFESINGSGDIAINVILSHIILLVNSIALFLDGIIWFIHFIKTKR